MKNLKALFFTVICMLFLFSCNTMYDDKACVLKKAALKGKITKIAHNHETVFYVDSNEVSFPFHFELDKDSYRELNEVEKGEKFMLTGSCRFCF